jgi:hypothetical protein
MPDPPVPKSPRKKGWDRGPMMSGALPGSGTGRKRPPRPATQPLQQGSSAEEGGNGNGVGSQEMLFSVSRTGSPVSFA